MIHETFSVTAEGSLNGGATLCTYLLELGDEFRYRKRPLILICPGGGYGMTSRREAEPLALAFNAAGYHAAVLYYSCAPARFPTQILEIAQAWKLICDRAEEWGVLQEQTVILGCSAGGHLAASYGIFCGEKFVTDRVNMSAKQLRPRGMILCYPVISAGKYAHRGSFENLLGASYTELSNSEKLEQVSLEKQVTAETPECFIWHTSEDDCVPVQNSYLFALALKEKGIDCELHVFANGPHGLSLAKECTAHANAADAAEKECSAWFSLAIGWLKKRIGFALPIMPLVC